MKRTVNGIYKDKDGDKLYVSYTEILSVEGKDSMGNWYEAISINGKQNSFQNKWQDSKAEN